MLGWWGITFDKSELVKIGMTGKIKGEEYITLNVIDEASGRGGRTIPQEELTMEHSPSDALVFFGAKGDLAYKKILS